MADRCNVLYGTDCVVKQAILYIKYKAKNTNCGVGLPYYAISSIISFLPHSRGPITHFFSTRCSRTPSVSILYWDARVLFKRKIKQHAVTILSELRDQRYMNHCLDHYTASNDIRISPYTENMI